MGWEINTRGASAAPALLPAHPGIQAASRELWLHSDSPQDPPPPAMGTGWGSPTAPPGTPKPRRAQQRRQNETERPRAGGKEVLFQVSPPGRASCSHQRVLRAGGHPGVPHTSRDPRLALGGSRRVGGHSRTPPRGAGRRWEPVLRPRPHEPPPHAPKAHLEGLRVRPRGLGGAGTPSATGAGAPGEPRSPGSRPACAARGPARSSRPCGCPRCRRTPAPVPWGTNAP